MVSAVWHRGDSGLIPNPPKKWKKEKKKKKHKTRKTAYACKARTLRAEAG